MINPSKEYEKAFIILTPLYSDFIVFILLQII